MAERVPPTIRKAAIDLEGTFLDAALAERKRFTAMMQQLNLDRVTDPAKWDAIRRQSEIAETYASHAATKNEMWRQQVKYTSIGVFARNSMWAFPTLRSLHFIGISMLVSVVVPLI